MQHVIYRLSLELTNAAATNVYTIFGANGSPMNMPPAWQSDGLPCEEDTGGVNPEMIAHFPLCEYDSWLTVGITECANTEVNTRNLPCHEVLSLPSRLRHCVCFVCSTALIVAKNTALASGSLKIAVTPNFAGNFEHWDSATGFQDSDCAVFWIDPGAGPPNESNEMSRKVAVAQLTIPEGVGW